MSNEKLSESDIRAKFITPAIKESGWDNTQIQWEVSFTDGRIIARGNLHKRDTPRRADYILSYQPNQPLAVVEAKDDRHSVGDGMQQALEYAEMLDIPFVYSSNGKAFLEHDRSTPTPTEREIPLDQFPSPQELWHRYCNANNITPEVEKIITQPYYLVDPEKELRYFQRIAVSRTVEAIAKGQNRVLLVMATGTGKTFTAFHIIWRLWKSGAKKRILFLADRNILIDQAKTNDFKPFDKAMTKISNRTTDPSYEIYLSLYQAITGPEESKKIYRNFSRDFFDLIVIDECHRGSANADSEWREILDYFSDATHIGLTATPKETEYVSNIHYFGEPVYTYSLKQGIDDGFLAPYKVVRIDLDKDLTGWRPIAGARDKYDREIEDRIYNQRDFDREMILEKRTELVAEKVAEFLQNTDEMAKTIVFCQDINHAERMRSALVNACSEMVAKYPRYVVRITGDSEEGKRELDNFIDPESRTPVIATTSMLLTTGVDVRTCKLIVIDQQIESMSLFKQIIGRGTRILEEFGKRSFTIMDFRRATELFADPDFDGEPVQVYEPANGQPAAPSEYPQDNSEEQNLGEDKKQTKYYVNNVNVGVQQEREQFIDPETGKLITESLRDYTRDKVKSEYESLDQFLKRWKTADKKTAVLAELESRGVPFHELHQAVGKDYDPFDLICHVAFGQPPLTRRERAKNVKKQNYFAKYSEKAKEILEALLDKYADEGISDLESVDVLRVPPFREMGTPVELIKPFGSRHEFMKAVGELEEALYKEAG